MHAELMAAIAVILALMLACTLAALRALDEREKRTERLLWELYGERPDRGRVIPSELTQRLEIQLGKRAFITPPAPQR